jgi:hypothetical protein
MGGNHPGWGDDSPPAARTAFRSVLEHGREPQTAGHAAPLTPRQCIPVPDHRRHTAEPQDWLLSHAWQLMAVIAVALGAYLTISAPELTARTTA